MDRYSFRTREQLSLNKIHFSVNLEDIERNFRMSLNIENISAINQYASKYSRERKKPN